MALRLFLNALFRVDHEKRDVSVGGAGNHVFKKFFVTRRVDDDVVSLFCFEKHLRHVNRDALIALFFQSIQQKREFKTLALIFANFFHVRDLGFGNKTRLVKQTPHERGFAVVDVTDHHDFKRFTPCHRFGGGCRHYM